MQLSLFDYLVILVLYMFVSMKGDKLMKVVAFDKLSGLIPLNKTTSGVLIHAVFFVLMLMLVNLFASKLAGYKCNQSDN